MMDIKVKTKQREYDFQGAVSWKVDELFLVVGNKNGERRFIKTDDIEDFLVSEVKENGEQETSY